MLSQFILNAIIIYREQMRDLCIKAIQDKMPDTEFNKEVEKIIHDMDVIIASL